MRLIRVTLGAAATRITAAQIYTPFLEIQNNANDICRVGDNTVTATRGILLSPTGAAPSTVPSFIVQRSDNRILLNQYYLFGTAGDQIDIIYE